jgi:RNA polymerase sigma-70 factor, ECF subfamily
VHRPSHAPIRFLDGLLPIRVDSGVDASIAAGCRPAGASAYWHPVMVTDTDASDEELMLGYRDGDAGAFDVLYTRHKGGIYRYLLRQCRNAALADELFQDVWMNLIRARAGYTVQAKFATYLYRIAHNRLMDHFRRHDNTNVSLDDESGASAADPVAPRSDDPQASAESREQAAQLLALLDALPPEQREAFVLQQEGGLSIEEIAATTGVARETAKSRLRYAVAKLREGMQTWQ